MNLFFSPFFKWLGNIYPLLWLLCCLCFHDNLIMIGSIFGCFRFPTGRMDGQGGSWQMQVLIHVLAFVRSKLLNHFNSICRISFIKKNKSSIILLQPCRVKLFFFCCFLCMYKILSNAFRYLFVIQTQFNLKISMRSLFEIVMLPFLGVLSVIRRFNCEIQKQK